MRKPRVEVGEQVARVGFARARGVRDRADVAERDAAELLAREVLLDLLLHPRRERNAGSLEEADLHRLGIGRRRTDVERGVVALRLQQVLADRRRQRAQVGDVHARRVQAGDERALDHPVRRRALAARHDTRAALQRGAERGPEAQRDLGRQVDVDEADDSVLREHARRAARLPDEALVDLRAVVDLLVRVDADARVDDGLVADRHLVADRDALVDARMRPDVGVAPDDRAFDHCASADVARRVEDRPRNAAALSQRGRCAEHRVRADRSLR
jgi:hypothetical protein